MTRSPRSASDEGTGLVTLAGGLLVFLIFLLFATQLLVGLHARSIVTAVASDAAHRAASEPTVPVDEIEATARGLLGRAGRDATFEWHRVDDDGDGRPDAVTLTLIVAPPTFVPEWIGSGSWSRIERTVGVRLEDLR